MSSVGVFSMKCSHSVMNISVVSTVGHSPWLNEGKNIDFNVTDWNQTHRTQQTDAPFIHKDEIKS